MAANGEIFELDEYPEDRAEPECLKNIGEDEGDFITLDQLVTLLEGKQQ